MRAGTRIICTLTIALAAFAAVFPLAVRAQQSSGNILVVFDSSGSMWGNLKGTSANKFELAREALARSLPDAASGVGTGLLIFGPGCTRADVAPAPARREVEATLARLRSLNPRSKGPITLALERGIEVLDAGKPAAMILLIDGPDNCRRDPCEVAQRIANERPGLKLHTIGLGIGAAPSRSVSCMSGLTGGKYFSAQTGQQAEQAIADAIKLAMLDTQKLAKPKLARKPGRAKRPRAKFDPNGPPQLVLTAAIGENGEALDKPVRWQVFKASDQGKANKLPVLDVLEAQLAVPLAAGRYSVIAALGRARFEKEVRVAKRGPTRLSANFDAGMVKLSVPTSQSGGESQIPTLVTVSRIANQDGGKAELVPFVISPYRQSELILPAGRYKVRAESGPLVSQRDISVTTGSIEELSLPIGSGEIFLSSDALIRGKRVDELEFVVAVDDPDRPGGRRTVARSAAPNPSFRLPAGTYYVDVKAGLAKASDRVALGAGREISKKLNLQVARISVDAAVSVGRNSRRRPIIFKLYSVGSSLQVLARSSAAAPQFLVPPGRYRVVAEVGARNVRAAENVEVAAGDDARIEMGVRAGDIKLRVADSNGSPLTGQFWEVRDDAGRMVWRTQQSAPSGLLSPGRYEVRCETRRGVVEGAFEVAAGDTKTIELRVQ
ncbi:MAG: hypothetical protein K0U74_10880 [Alphaproteobacteria bacterium]|nr:hypothetical protein [Alphaproteobacteria bacterium]